MCVLLQTILSIYVSQNTELLNCIVSRRHTQCIQNKKEIYVGPIESDRLIGPRMSDSKYLCSLEEHREKYLKTLKYTHVKFRFVHVKRFFLFSLSYDR